MAVEEVHGDVQSASESVEETTAKRYPVAPGVALNVRSGPGTNYRLIKVLPIGARVPINCQKPGEWVSGPYGTSNLWDNIANGQFVADAYVNTGSDGYVTIRCS
ncbi:peptidase [Streptomyces sp. NPDC005408]|uniref:peptidase n=1 Tax=Streptomyces sp. NPDC005408 TaxID=3155341 RepID=UPI0033AB60FA